MSSSCPICGYDGTQLSPSDAAVALRSFPRRFRRALARPDEDEDRPDDVLHRRPKGGGLSAIEHAAAVAAGLARADEAFRDVMYRRDPDITLPPVDVEPPVEAVQDPPDVVVDRIKAAAEGLADAIESAPGDGWARTGRSPDGPVTALDVVRTGVHIGVHHLHLIERTITEVVHDLS
jgi:hypothetical protein